ncbi:uncharacterized protein [Nothobranchius furzeri]|nr:putative LOC107385490-like protein [Nothobranchius furzeri]
MTLLTLTFCLTALLFLSSAQKTTQKSSSRVRQDNGLFSANVGDNITLNCFYENDAVMLVWFKQTLGQKPNVISTFYKHSAQGHFHNEQKDNLRFGLEVGKGKNHLKISDVQPSDSATYYCVGVDGEEYEFGDAARVSVRDLGTIPRSESKTAQSGCFVTQNCSVRAGTGDGEHSVYWFKDSEEADPGLIYTHGQRERTPNLQPHSCMYHLPTKSLIGSHRCAVASCGHILFGNGIKLDSADDWNPSDSLIYILSGALTITTLLSVWVGFSVYKVNKQIQSHKESRKRNTDGFVVDSEGHQEEERLHHAAVRQQTFNRGTSQCVYSSVRQ